MKSRLSRQMTDTARPRESGDPTCSPSCRWIPAFAGMSGKVIAALLVFCASLTPALAQQQVKIGVGYGLAFLPVYICEDLKLIEKHGKEAHLDVKASYQRFAGAAPM